MINKAFLDPWVRQQMDRLVLEGMAVGLAPIVTSTWRDQDTQAELFRRCEIAQPGQRGFPVKRSPCSSHEWGFSFDSHPTARLDPIGGPPDGKSPGLAALFCHFFPDICRKREDLDIAPLVYGEIGRTLGLRWSSRDAIHFGAFTPGEWDPHMRSVWGLDCTTCTYPGGPRI